MIGKQLLVAGILLFAAPVAFAAQTVHLTLEIDGNAIEGDSTVQSLEREGTIECLSFEDSVWAPMDESTLSTTGKRVYDPIVIRKRIDKSSPLLAQALAHRQTVVATFRFYRPSPSGDGKEEHFYTIKIEGGYVASIATTSPDTLSPESAALPVTEEVQFTFSKITKTFTEGELEFEDNWKATR